MAESLFAAFEEPFVCGGGFGYTLGRILTASYEMMSKLVIEFAAI